MLKKCVVIMVMFALVTGVSFAQASFGGQLQTSAVLFSGNNVTDTDLNMGGAYNGPYTNAKFTVSFGDGTAGGRIVFDHMDATGNNNGGRFWGWMQWRPNQYFRVKVGSDEDGEWGFAQIVGWGFTGEAKNSVAVNDYASGYLPMTYRASGLQYGGFNDSSGFSLGMSVFPVDALQVNFLFRQIGTTGEISEKFAKMEVSASYNIEEVGTVRFAWEGKGGLMTDAADEADIGTLWLAFHSKGLVEGLEFEVGGNFNLPHLNSDLMGPVQVSAGLNLTSTDPFNFKFRMGSEFGGKNNKGDDIEKVGLSFGILPSYKFAKLTAFFHAGLGIVQDKKDADAVYKWFINPYIWVPMGGMRMWVGLQILDEHADRPDDVGQISWKIPFGFNFYF